jgi:GTP-binding protein
MLHQELASYATGLASRPRLIVGTKLDLPDAESRLAALAADLPDDRVMGISSFSREGLTDLKKSILALIGSAATADRST